MTISKAKRILGIAGNASPEELSALYRNLVQNAMDVRTLIAISSAYIAMQQNISLRDSDLDSAFHVNEDLKNYFAQAKDEYTTKITDIKGNLKTAIDNKIDYTNKTNELRSVVENDVPTEIQHSVTQVSQYLEELDERITLDQRYSLTRIFYHLYKERQRRWLNRFYETRLCCMNPRLRRAIPYPLNDQATLTDFGAAI